jgi:hypothetical protein
MGVMGPYAGADFKLTLYPLQSRLQHINSGQPCQSRLYPPVRDFGLGLWIATYFLSLSLSLSVWVMAVYMMQLHSGAEHFGKVIYRGIITRGCS